MNRNRCLFCNGWHPYRLICDQCLDRIEAAIPWAIAAWLALGAGVLTWLVVREGAR